MVIVLDIGQIETKDIIMKHQKSEIREVPKKDLAAISGGAFPIVLAAAGAGIGFGYMVGKDRAKRDNRND